MSGKKGDMFLQPSKPPKKSKRARSFIDFECEVVDDDHSPDDNSDQEWEEDWENFIADIPLPPDEDPPPNPYLHNNLTTQCPVHGEWVQNDCDTCTVTTWTNKPPKKNPPPPPRRPPTPSPPSTPIPPTPPDVRKRREREKEERDARVNAAIREGLERKDRNDMYCKLCDKRCYKEEFWENHLKGKLHQSKIHAQKQKNDRPITPAHPKPTSSSKEVPLQPRPHETVCEVCKKCVSKTNLAKHRKRKTMPNIKKTVPTI